MRGDALATILPPLAKRSPVEAKVGYSWQSPSQGFASIGESFASGGEERKRCDAIATTSPPLAKLSPVEAKAGDSSRSPSRRFASTGKTFASGGEHWPPR
ncbi:hypothetical protein R1flu_028573 [Riccia fluitans]|uniref:Uncharacterized protein n=1 Tax=Riccia fluitans TaxID=41844 RepID=A0ABD1XML8_9MARC